MKSRFLLIPTLTIIASASASADIVLEQDTTGVTGKSRTTMSIKGDLVRTDVGTESSVIINTETGDMTTLVHEEKMVMTMNAKALAAAATPPTPGKPAEPAKLVDTGKTEKIGDHDCTIYTMETMGVATKMWIAKKYPGYDNLKKELKVLEKMSSTGAKLPEMPGMAVKTETVTNGLTFTTTLVSLKTKKVDDAIFKVPAGYKAPGQ